MKKVICFGREAWLRLKELLQDSIIYHCGPIVRREGGAGALLAKKIKAVKRVFRLREFGMPEAMWVIEVNAYPAVVTMDAHGGNIHAKMLRQSRLPAM